MYEVELQLIEQVRDFADVVAVRSVTKKQCGEELQRLQISKCDTNTAGEAGGTHVHFFEL